jgi:hypothetical protein
MNSYFFLILNILFLKFIIKNIKKIIKISQMELYEVRI